MNKTEVMALLKENQNERGIDHWNQMGNRTGGLKSFGIGLTQLRKLAKKIGRDHELAKQLWNSNNYDAKNISLLIDDPKQLTREQVERQVEELNAGMLIHVFSSCDATLPKAPFAINLAKEWMDADDNTRRRCAWGLIYEISKFKGKKAPDETFFMDCIKRIRNNQKEDIWVRESMNGALIGIGKRSRALNIAAIEAVKASGPLDLDYGDDNNCKPVNVLKHLTSDYVKQKFGLN